MSRRKPAVGEHDPGWKDSASWRGHDTEEQTENRQSVKTGAAAAPVFLCGTDVENVWIVLFTVVIKEVIGSLYR